jgi:hypothetical protein
MANYPPVAAFAAVTATRRSPVAEANLVISTPAARIGGTAHLLQGGHSAPVLLASLPLRLVEYGGVFARTGVLEGVWKSLEEY